jgi:hypothetical protein
MAPRGQQAPGCLTPQRPWQSPRQSRSPPSGVASWHLPQRGTPLAAAGTRFLVWQFEHTTTCFMVFSTLALMRLPSPLGWARSRATTVALPSTASTDIAPPSANSPRKRVRRRPSSRPRGSRHGRLSSPRRSRSPVQHLFTTLIVRPVHDALQPKWPSLTEQKQHLGYPAQNADQSWICRWFQPDYCG